MVKLALLQLQKLLTCSLATSSSSGNNNNQQQQHQMTWHELGQQLLNLKNAGVPDDVIMGMRLQNLPLKRTRIDQSTNPSSGRGLFAIMDIKEGDFVTCYPGDIVLHETKGFKPTPNEDVGIVNDDMLRDYLCRYCIGITDEYAIMGLPHLDTDVAYAGHFINDGVLTPPTIEEELEDYIRESTSKANVQFLPLENLHLVGLATRDISKGEELFVSYGPFYWMEHTPTWRGGTVPSD